MRKKNPQQPDLPMLGQEFNLFSEEGEDPIRVIMDRLRLAAEQAERRSYELRMQRTFAECPGFIGGDAPQTETSKGWVVVTGAAVGDAVVWLKRKFHVNRKTEVDVANNGVRIEIMPRVRRAKGKHHKGRKVETVFAPPEQYTLKL